MHFAAICPTTYLDTFCKGRPVQMCLAQYCNDATYFEWYRAAAKRGEIVILDNGAWEEKLIDMMQLIKLAVELKATVVVAPDVKGDAWMTKYLTQAFRALSREIGLGDCEVCTMLQADPEDILELCSQYTRCDTNWVGFSRCLCEQRVHLARLLHATDAWDTHKKHHAFGMLGGSLGEARNLAKLDFFSMDSSNPIWRGHFSIAKDFDPTCASPSSYNYTLAIHATLSKVDQVCTSK